MGSWRDYWNKLIYNKIARRIGSKPIARARDAYRLQADSGRKKITITKTEFC